MVRSKQWGLPWNFRKGQNWSWGNSTNSPEMKNGLDASQTWTISRWGTCDMRWSLKHIGNLAPEMTIGWATQYWDPNSCPLSPLTNGRFPLKMGWERNVLFKWTLSEEAHGENLPHIAHQLQAEPSQATSRPSACCLLGESIHRETLTKCQLDFNRKLY